MESHWPLQWDLFLASPTCPGVHNHGTSVLILVTCTSCVICQRVDWGGYEQACAWYTFAPCLAQLICYVSVKRLSVWKMHVCAVDWPSTEISEAGRLSYCLLCGNECGDGLSPQTPHQLGIRKREWERLRGREREILRSRERERERGIMVQNIKSKVKTRKGIKKRET